jgi:hypothetical protein
MRQLKHGVELVTENVSTNPLFHDRSLKSLHEENDRFQIFRQQNRKL